MIVLALSVQHLAHTWEFRSSVAAAITKASLPQGSKWQAKHQNPPAFPLLQQNLVEDSSVARPVLDGGEISLVLFWITLKTQSPLLYFGFSVLGQ